MERRQETVEAWEGLNPAVTGFEDRQKGPGTKSDSESWKQPRPAASRDVGISFLQPQGTESCPQPERARETFSRGTSHKEYSPAAILILNHGRWRKEPARDLWLSGLWGDNLVLFQAGKFVLIS